MKHAATIIVTTLIVLLSITSDYASDTIKVVVTNNPPLASKDVDGNFLGFSIDILEYIAEKENWRLQYVHNTFAESLKTLESEEATLHSTLAYSKRRDEKYDFTKETLFHNWSKVYKFPRANIDSLFDLEGRSVSLVRKSIHSNEFKKLIAGLGINSNLIETVDNASAFKLVDEGRADAVVTSRTWGAKFARNYNVQETSIIFNPIEIRYAVLKGKNQYILETIDKYLQILKEDKNSIYYQSLNNIFIADTKRRLSPWLKLALGISFIMIMISFGIIVLFRKQLGIKTDEIRQSEIKFFTIFNKSNDGILVADEGNRKFILANNTICEMLGYSKDELKDLSVDDIHPEEALPAVLDDFRKLTAGEIKMSHATPVLRKDGSVFYADISASFMKIKEKECIVGSYRNITERKKAEEALWESEERFRTLFDTSNTAICLARDGKQLFINKAFANLFGYDSPEEIIGTSITDVIAPELREAILERNARREKGEDVQTVYESVGYKKDGTRFPIEINVTSVKIEGILSTLVFISDISIRKESEERFRLLTDASQEGVCIHDKGVLLDANKKFVEIFAWDSLDDMIGMNVLDLASEDTRDIVLENIKTSFEEPYEATALKKDGTTSPIMIQGKRYIHGEKTVRVATVRDISKEKDAEAKILASLKEKEVLLIEIHHRVKNNMAVISSLLSLQSRYVDDSKYLEMFKESQSRIKSMALVHEKLYQSEDFAHIDVKDYIETLALYIKTTFAGTVEIRSNIEIEDINIDIDTLIPCGLIINELLTNAFKHAFDGHDNPAISISLKKADDDKVILIIADKGKGFPDGFDLSKSMGLGLKLVNILVNQIRGTLDVKSSQGVTFTITFPEYIENAKLLPDYGNDTDS